MVGVVALSSLAGYGLARFRFPGNNIIFFAFVLGLMIPFFSVMIPLFYELQGLGLLGTKAAVILPAIAGASGFGVPLGVFLMRSFYMDLPEELADAGRVDGAGEFQVFWRIMLPLSLPGVAVLAVLVFFHDLEQLRAGACVPAGLGEPDARQRALPVRRGRSGSTSCWPRGA